MPLSKNALSMPLTSRALQSITIILFGFYSFLSALRHFLLHSGIYDLGLFTQWSYLVGIGQPWQPSSLTNYLKPALGDHLSLSLLSISPILKLLPNAYVLLLIQSLGLSLLCTLVYNSIVTKGDRSFTKLIKFLAISLNPSIFNSALNDFHPEVAFSLLGYLSLLQLRRKQYRPALLLLSLFVLTKEAMAIFAICFAIYALLCKQYRIALFVAPCALVYFKIASSIVDQYQNYASSRYAHLGENFLDVLINTIIHPHILLSTVFTLQTASYLLGLLLPIVFLLRSVNSYKAIIASFPLLAANILSSSDVMRAPIYQYQLPVVLFFFLAASESVGSRRIPFHQNLTRVLDRLSLASLTVSFILLTQWQNFFTTYLRHLNLTLDVAYAEIRYSDPKISIWAHPRIASHFSARTDIFHQIEDIEKYMPELLLFPSYQRSRPPQYFLQKIRNLIFSYGEAPEFADSLQLIKIANSSGYKCATGRLLTCTRIARKN